MNKTKTETKDLTASPVNALVMLPLPDNMERMESGSVQFGDDWPGIFLRGDNAMFFGYTINCIVEGIKNGREIGPVELNYLEQVAEALNSCKVT